MTLSTINTVRFKPLILWVNAGYGTGVKIPTPQLRMRVINRAFYFTNGKGTWGGDAYYLWGACCMRGNTVILWLQIVNDFLQKKLEIDKKETWLWAVLARIFRLPVQKQHWQNFWLSRFSFSVHLPTAFHNILCQFKPLPYHLWIDRSIFRQE